MISFFLCLSALVFSYLAGRRSLVAGLVTVLTFGYFYGILRANLAEVFSHFIFDAAVLGLYAAQFTKRPAREQARRQQSLKLWVAALVAWPCLLFLAPMQDYAVQLVGLRGNIFLLPFLMLGARLREEDFGRLALAFAVLNLVAFGFACAEFVLGVERFFPQNQVTELIYRSAVDDNFANPDRVTALRIPSVFTGAHAYAGMMVLTFPFLFGAWGRKEEDRPRRHGALLTAAMVASLLGVFMAAARTPVVILALMLVMTLHARRVRAQVWAVWLAALIAVGWIVSSEGRLQRFLTMKDTEMVSDRLYWSVNENIFDLFTEYPLGNGLGGGGTSIPYFLQGRIVPPTVFLENEYARILLEQGVIGLCLWVAFVLWLLMRANVRRSDACFVGRRLIWVACAATFASGLTGTGTMTSIPGTALLLLGAGWIAVRQPSPALSSSTTARTTMTARGEGTARELARQYG